MKPSINTLVKAKQRGDDRIYMPLQDFKEVYKSIVHAEKEVAGSDLSDETKWMLHRGYIISIVTAVEVYFRDMFTAFGTMAQSSGITIPLNQIHTALYSVDEMQSFYKNKISPHSVVANSINFQNVKSIGIAFSHLLGRPFWPAVKERSAKEASGMEWMITDKFIEIFRATLRLRHELVPCNR